MSRTIRCKGYSSNKWWLAPELIETYRNYELGCNSKFTEHNTRITSEGMFYESQHKHFKRISRRRMRNHKSRNI